MWLLWRIPRLHVAWGSVTTELKTQVVFLDQTLFAQGHYHFQSSKRQPLHRSSGHARLRLKVKYGSGQSLTTVTNTVVVSIEDCGVSCTLVNSLT